MFTNAGSNRSYSDIGVSEGHHELSHHGKSDHKQEQIAKINRYHIDRFAYLLKRLKSIRDGERTLAGNSMIIYGSGVSDGDRHNHDDLPILMAGNAGGRIKTGRHIAYKNGNTTVQSLRWMMQQMGAKVDQFGGQRWRRGPVGLSSNGAKRPSSSRVRLQQRQTRFAGLPWAPS